MKNPKSISNEYVLLWAAYDLTDHQSTLVQVMDWCIQAINH